LPPPTQLAWRLRCAAPQTYSRQPADYSFSRRGHRHCARLSSIQASDAHVALGVCADRSRDRRLAEDEFRTAIALAELRVGAQALRPFLASMGRFAESKAEADRACDVDPLCLVVATNAAWVSMAGELDAAIDRCGHPLDMDPPSNRASHLGVALIAAGGPGGCRRAVVNL
jgi:hypothetical protein